jgi:hypothetical protein
VSEDVGAGGCLVVVPRALRRDELLSLTISPGAAQPALHVKARVAWAKGPRFGIRFVAPRPGGETPVAWFARFAAAHPDMSARVRAAPRTLPLDTRIHLGAPPQDGLLSGNGRAIACRVHAGACVADLLALTTERELFAMLSRGFLSLLPTSVAHLVAWERLLARCPHAPVDAPPWPAHPAVPAVPCHVPARALPPPLPARALPPPLPAPRPRRAPEAQQLYQAGVSLLVTGDALAAETLFRRALEYAPHDGTIRGVLRQFE